MADPAGFAVANAVGAVATELLVPADLEVVCSDLDSAAEWLDLDLTVEATVADSAETDHLGPAAAEETAVE